MSASRWRRSSPRRRRRCAGHFARCRREPVPVRRRRGHPGHGWGRPGAHLAGAVERRSHDGRAAARYRGYRGTAVARYGQRRAGGGRRRAHRGAVRRLRRHRLRHQVRPRAARHGTDRRLMGGALDLLTIAAVSLGALFFLAGTVGLLRFPDTLSRLHALTKADNVGLALVVIGLLPRVDGALDALKLIAIWLLVLLSGSTISQLVARVARDEVPPE